jgi:hypothetical protein
MRTIASNQVRKVLRKTFNLRPRARGNGTGHEVWVAASGRSFSPLLRKKDISVADLFSIGLEMETKGIAERRAFMRAVLG